MLLNSRDIFVKEFLSHEKIDSTNISIAKSRAFKNGYTDSFKEFGALTFMNHVSEGIPKNILRRVLGNLNEYTDFTYLYPRRFFQRETSITDNQLDVLCGQGKIFEKVIEIQNTEFMVFNKEFRDGLFENCVFYVIGLEELEECVQKKYIDGHIFIANSNKVLVWY